ncbi:AAA family ATPase [Pseudophaeobacter arcticus]|uniref:AAA family ATPase n=1 Tax=Pseudophaeobacter arcticus TaxID=385492 RepID=A0ABQ0AS80_9RHOB
MSNDIDSNLLTLSGHSQTPKGIVDALKRQSGSRYYKCAFQVNPYQYCLDHAKNSGFDNEADYNDKMAQACKANGIEVVGITDHFRVSESQGLADKLTEYGITVFLGFEANSYEGVHLLCLFPPDTSQTDLTQAIGACGIDDPSDTSPISNKHFLDLVKIIDEKGGLSIAAHVTQKSGLLTTLKGKPRAKAWKSDLLNVAAIPETVAGMPNELQKIATNKDHAHKRDRPIALINACDVSSPDDFSKNGASTLLRMSDVTLEGLKQCFLDHESRIRLNSDPELTDHARLVAVSWEGGLLGDQNLHLNAGLNVLVGGRGAGKSTIIESIRYAFDMEPRGKEAKNGHKSMIKALMGSKSAISVLIYKPTPSPQFYLIERAHGQDPKVKNKSGEIIPDLNPHDLMPSFEIYGQHEISELTRDKSALAEILTRFVGQSAGQQGILDGIQARLKESRSAISGKQQTLDQLDDALLALPSLKEQLKQFSDTDLVGKLSEKTALQDEARILSNLSQKIEDLKSTAVEIKPDDADKALVLPKEDEKELPNREVLEPLEALASTLNTTRENAASALIAAAEKATQDLKTVKDAWTPLSEAAEKRYEDLVKKLKADGADPEGYVSIKEQVENLKPKETEKITLLEELSELQTTRQAIIDEWEKADRDAFQELAKAAKRVSKKLKSSVKASVIPSTDLTPLKEIFARHTDGSNSTAISRLEEVEDLSMSELARNIRKGAAALISAYNFTDNGAQKLANGGESLALEVEECRLPAQAIIELNVGRGGAENWKDLDRLSAGQRATTVLMLLLLEADAPLIVDQPEDDLDNQFIVQHVVETMRNAKESRQFLFSSHNPNIPVLGDAEQIIGLTPTVEGGVDQTIIDDALCGAIDTPKVKDLIKEQLEGGEQAFRTREQKYGF